MLTVIIDAQAGSCGKGKVAAFLALRDKPSVVAASFGPNAGHTVWIPRSLDPDPKRDQKLVFRHLPAASVYPDAEILIGASAIIDRGVLSRELEMAEAAGIPVYKRLRIHPRAAVITEEDQIQEAAALRGISSTMKGVGAAIARKVMRQSKLAGDYPELHAYTKRWSERFLHRAVQQEDVLIETSQGFDLCLNHGVAYPFCTSRQVNAAQVLADFGLPITTMTEVVAVIRPYPIRVGNISETETSGPYAEDTKELTWEKVAKAARMPENAVKELLAQELTTVTGRQRRVFSFSAKRFARFCQVNQPNSIALNFADQLAWGDRDARSAEQLSTQTRHFIEELETISQAPVVLVGTGPHNDQMIQR